MLAASLVGMALLTAQSPPPASGPIVRFTATTANVAGAPDAIRIDLVRWSIDAEREKLMSAWNMKPGASGGRGRTDGTAGRGGARGGRGGSAPDPAPDPGNPDDLALPSRPAPRANSERPGPRPTPEGALAIALTQATTVGYLWSSEVAGYAIRYAGKITAADGSERIILITDRRLGVTNELWNPTSQAVPAPYDFSVVELRVNAKGEGEGRVTVTGKVAPDSAAGIIAPAEYEALPLTLTNVKRTTVQSH
jgi:hypothetical protein